jgi:hypothetical protein
LREAKKIRRSKKFQLRKIQVKKIRNQNLVFFLISVISAISVISVILAISVICVISAIFAILDIILLTGLDKYDIIRIR